jgi:hypothetical protein
MIGQPTPGAPAVIVIAAHRRAAFAAMHWAGWTFEAAQANDMRRRLIECRAHQIAARELAATLQPTRQPVRRVRLNARGQVADWCTQIVMGPRVVTQQRELLEKA